MRLRTPSSGRAARSGGSALRFAKPSYYYGSGPAGSEGGGGSEGAGSNGDSGTSGTGGSSGSTGGSSGGVTGGASCWGGAGVGVGELGTEGVATLG